MNKIFGLGLSRTGTTTLTIALQELGFNIIHYPKSEQQLFNANNDGATDIPVITYYKKLDKKFPGSKFIYTVREKEDWLNAMERYLPRKKNWSTTSWQKLHRISVYGRIDFDRKTFSEKYDLHDHDIRSYFSKRPNDLLILNICNGDDIEKLLSFINFTGVTTLKKFPHTNEIIK